MFLVFFGCGTCLPCLSGCYAPAWMGRAGLNSLRRWKKLLPSVGVRLSLRISIVPLPKIGPMFLREEPWQHLAVLTGWSYFLANLAYYNLLASTNTNCLSSPIFLSSLILSFYFKRAVDLVTEEISSRQRNIT